MRKLGLGISNKDLNTILAKSVDSASSSVVQAADFLCGKNFIDSRDSQSYPTVKIGAQCWTAKNINFGNTISNASEQKDNSVVEKYCKDVSSCAIFGGLYQWAEAVQYANKVTNETGTSVGDKLIQGICPINWHVPSDNEIKTLERSLSVKYYYR